MKPITAINLILGVWLIGAPLVLTTSSGHVTGMPIDSVLGLLLVASSLSCLTGLPGHLGFAAYEGVCGIGAMLTPRVLGGRMAPSLAANSAGVGALVLVVSLAEAWILASRARRAQ